MELDIKGLYKIENNEKMQAVETLVSAFEEYPKLINTFTDKERRMVVLKASIIYYLTFDIANGAVFSLDEEKNEIVALLQLDDNSYNLKNYEESGCLCKEYMNEISKLSQDEIFTRDKLFEELELLEEGVDLPTPQIYVDFLGVKKEKQRQGRGKKIMDKIIEYSEFCKIPLALFTNTQEDIEFYKSLGFVVVAVVRSEKFGFENTYLVRNTGTLKELIENNVKFKTEMV